jgi:hypothetical protein
MLEIVSGKPSEEYKEEFRGSRYVVSWSYVLSAGLGRLYSHSIVPGGFEVMS